MNRRAAGPILAEARLRAARPISADTFWLDLETPAAELFLVPGAFAKLRGWPTPGRAGGPLLDRPFALHRAAEDGLQFLIRRVGPATRLLETLPPGAPFRITGPLGRSLAEAVPDPPGFYLAAGGVGLAPMALVMDWLAASGRPARLFYGERLGVSQADQNWLAAWAGDFTATVEDGSGYGRRGLVTEALAEALAREPRPVFACGPAPMLAAVVALAERFEVTPWISMEAGMACGLGVCLSCSLPLKGGGRFRVCREGPVVDGRIVDWSGVR